MLFRSGVRCVSISISDFDTHQGNFPRMRQVLPIVDHGLHALVTDLEERGMLQNVSIVVWGEFGRTPKINASGGRDHWPAAGPALLAGGGMKVGQVIGSTNDRGERPRDRRLHPNDVWATVYKNLGVDPQQTFINNAGRPVPILPHGKPIAELL